MRQCSKCQEWKPETEFNKSKKGRDGLSSYCKKCIHTYYYHTKADKVKQKSKEYYYNHHGQVLDYARNRRIKNKVKRFDFMNEIKTNCVRCGESRKYLVEFHHINPKDKTSNIGEYKAVSQALLDEIGKCVCLCRNCHSEFHYFYGNNPDKPVDYLIEYLGTDPYSLVPKVQGGVYQCE